MVVQDQIDEVSPEQEEAESQENIHNIPNFYQPSAQKHQQMADMEDEEGVNMGDED